jgi:hypothetical protein
VRELVQQHDLRDRRAIRLEPPPEPEQLTFPLAPGQIVPPGAITP